MEGLIIFDLNKICIINKISNSNINKVTENIRDMIRQENITKESYTALSGPIVSNDLDNVH